MHLNEEVTCDDHLMISLFSSSFSLWRLIWWKVTDLTLNFSSQSLMSTMYKPIGFGVWTISVSQTSMSFFYGLRHSNWYRLPNPSAELLNLIVVIFPYVLHKLVILHENHDNKKGNYPGPLHIILGCISTEYWIKHLLTSLNALENIKECLLNVNLYSLWK